MKMCSVKTIKMLFFKIYENLSVSKFIRNIVCEDYKMLSVKAYKMLSDKMYVKLSSKLYEMLTLKTYKILSFRCNKVINKIGERFSNLNSFGIFDNL